MKPFNCISKKPVALVTLAWFVLAGLSGCGGGGHNNNVSGTPATAALDAYFTAVSSVVSASSETTEPIPIEAMATTAPDDTEPAPLG